MNMLSYHMRRRNDSLDSLYRWPALPEWVCTAAFPFSMTYALLFIERLKDRLASGERQRETTEYCSSKPNLLAPPTMYSSK